MSSTRWGKVATVSGEGGVACGDLATGGTESSGLWACASRDKGWSGGSHLQSSKHEHEFRDSACVFEYFLVFLQHRVRMSFSCLPSHPPMYWGVSYGGVLLGLAGAGIGGQRAVVLPRLPGAPARALYGGSR